ncbi:MULTISPECIES: hypothetical protein [unclassified Moorena]|nr:MULTISPECIES: hypothetical protein [unclassified Moorena]
MVFPRSLLPTPYSLFPVPCSLFPIPFTIDNKRRFWQNCWLLQFI